jgi:D-isomer specific 2-hydroxyacid dehydrogenase, NAD binding domain
MEPRGHPLGQRRRDDGRHGPGLRRPRAAVHPGDRGDHRRTRALALDVFTTEPLPAGSPLWGLPNVIVSPHMSGDFRGWDEALTGLFLDQLRRYRAGRLLANVVDKTLGYVPSAPR